MSYRRCGMLPVLLLFIRSSSVLAEDRPGLNAAAGATLNGLNGLNGVFFPYAVATATLEVEPNEKPECSCWRALGAVAGGAGAFVLYLPFAMSDSRIGVSDTQRVLEHSAITAGAAYLGYLIGRRLDRR
jgi:hypothetical protein